MRILLLALVAIAHAETVDPSYLKLLEWRSVGPSRGGRVEAVAGDPVNKLVFYMGATGGGVWKTDDGGITWRNISDAFFKTGSVGAIVLAPSDPNVTYVGIVATCFRADPSPAVGFTNQSAAGPAATNLAPPSP